MKKSVLFKAASVVTLTFPVFFMTACLDNHKPAKNRPGSEAKDAQVSTDGTLSKIDLSKCVKEDEKDTSLKIEASKCAEATSGMISDSVLAKLISEKSIALNQSEDKKAVSAIELNNEGKAVWNNEVLIQKLATMDKTTVQALHAEIRSKMINALNLVEDESKLVSLVDAANEVSKTSAIKDAKEKATSKAASDKQIQEAMKAFESGAQEHKNTCKMNALLKSCEKSLVGKDGLSARDVALVDDIKKLAPSVIALLKSDLAIKSAADLKDVNLEDKKRLGPLAILVLKWTDKNGDTQKTIEAAKQKIQELEAAILKVQDEKKEIDTAVTELSAKLEDSSLEADKKTELQTQLDEVKKQQEEKAAELKKLTEELEKTKLSLQGLEEDLATEEPKTPGRGARS